MALYGLWLWRVSAALVHHFLIFRLKTGLSRPLVSLGLSCVALCVSGRGSHHSRRVRGAFKHRLLQKSLQPSARCRPSIHVHIILI